MRVLRLLRWLAGCKFWAPERQFRHEWLELAAQRDLIDEVCLDLGGEG